MAHPWFRDIDFEKLERLEINPATVERNMVPDVKDEADSGMVDKVFTTQPRRESDADEDYWSISSRESLSDPLFPDFTYDPNCTILHRRQSRQRSYDPPTLVSPPSSPAWLPQDARD